MASMWIKKKSIYSFVVVMPSFRGSHQRDYSFATPPNTLTNPLCNGPKRQRGEETTRSHSDSPTISYHALSADSSLSAPPLVHDSHFPVHHQVTCNKPLRVYSSMASVTVSLHKDVRLGGIIVLICCLIYVAVITLYLTVFCFSWFCLG